MSEGISIVICCYNSARRLPDTLAHLLSQRVSDDLPWEVIVVDNASTDDTAQRARALWAPDAPAPLRVVTEPHAGLSHARRRGFAAAQYELVSFVDDDNWVAEDWVATLQAIMSAHPEAGACGGMSEPVFEVEPPEWFHKFHGKMAIGEQAAEEGDVTETRGSLWGAGLTVRKQAWVQIKQAGWRSLQQGRKGKQLTGGEDIELCYMLRLLGWRLYYSQRLQLWHFIPQQRLQWEYLMRMAGASGQALIISSAYARVLNKDDPQDGWMTMREWQRDTRSALSKLKGVHQKTKHLSHAERVGNPNVFLFARYMSLLRSLITLGPRRYQTLYRMVRDCRSGLDDSRPANCVPN